MPVNGLDHVNIVASDLDATVAFYVALLGFKRQDISVLEKMGLRGAWLCDETGAPIIHVQGFTEGRHKHNDAGPDTPTGAIDHVALRCEGFAGMLARLGEMGIEHKVNDRQYGDLRQIFVRDPDNVQLELNYHND